MHFDFDWDFVKAEENRKKHRISFRQATQVFNDPRRLEKLDVREDYGEERWTVIGSVMAGTLFVVYTIRTRKFRIISARKGPSE